jgi:hypothetical protein
MEWNLDLPFFDLVGMTYYFKEEEGKKKRGFGAGENWRLHVCELWLDHTKLARCVKGPLTLNIYLTYTRSTLKIDSNEFIKFLFTKSKFTNYAKISIILNKVKLLLNYTHTHIYKIYIYFINK